MMPVLAANAIANRVSKSLVARAAPTQQALANKPPKPTPTPTPRPSPTPTPRPSPTPTATLCTPGTLTFSGSSATDGPDGNIRTFSAGSVSVHASAFSVKKSNLVFETAYLGLYPEGLGVTDRGEGDGSQNRHRVDNIGDRVNFVLFEFNTVVVPDKAFLNNVGADSDATVFIGTANDPFNHHLTPNGVMLSVLENNDGGSS